MVKVITYGSYDLFHYGHKRLLERAKALGDYLIVGVTSDDYDKTRGKINLQQSLMERVEAVRSTGIADEIIIEEYEGQKIDDIRKYDVDIFTVGSDWEGYFDYLNEYCKVIYLPRTEGVSSSEIRQKQRKLRFGMVGDTSFLNKVWSESKYVNGLDVEVICTSVPNIINDGARKEAVITQNYEELLDNVEAVYIRSLPKFHYQHIAAALERGKHVLCESPVTLNYTQCVELAKIAHSKHLVLMEAIKTAYATAYSRLLLLIKAGKIGDVVSVDAVCTSIKERKETEDWNCICEWGPTALLPIFQILGTNFNNSQIVSHFDKNGNEGFVKVDFVYNNAVGSIKVGDGVKSEGCLIISGTKGYVYVPAPWWKTDYFEVRYENAADNKRYFYQLDGEGIRYELVSFARAIESGKILSAISNDITACIAGVMERFNNKENVTVI